MYGHRISEDLDLFTSSNFDNSEISEVININFSNRVDIRTTSRFGIFCYIDNVKVDIVRYSHPIIRPSILIDGIRMFSTEDIVAMKVQAILGRAKKKDFWDIAELLKHYNIEEFSKFHKVKFNTQNLLISVPNAILYFDDANDSVDPVSLKNQTWTSVKAEISKAISDYLR